MLLILTKSRVGDFWNLVRKWFKRQFDAVAASIDFTPVEEKIDALDEKVTPYLYDLCTAEDIDHMFDANTEDGQIIIPAEAVQPDGSISLNLFTAITGLTPVVANNEQG